MDVIEYQQIHQLVRETYGKASEYDCVDCDEAAKEWSHEHESDRFDINNYWPRCISCHRKYDSKQPGVSFNRSWSKRGHTHSQGSKHGNSRISESDVVEIRRLAETLSRKEIALMYKLAPNTVSQIVLGTRWHHVEC